MALVQRKDEVFFIKWRESGLNIDSQQLKFRKLIKWPTINHPCEIISVISEIERILNVSFFKHANIQGNLVERIHNKALLIEWLGSTARDYGCFE